MSISPARLTRSFLLALAALGLTGCASLEGLWELCAYQPTPIAQQEPTGQTDATPTADPDRPNSAP